MLGFYDISNRCVLGANSSFFSESSFLVINSWFLKFFIFILKEILRKTRRSTRATKENRWNSTLSTVHYLVEWNWTFDYTVAGKHLQDTVHSQIIQNMLIAPSIFEDGDFLHVQGGLHFWLQKKSTGVSAISVLLFWLLLVGMFFTFLLILSVSVGEMR